MRGRAPFQKDQAFLATDDFCRSRFDGVMAAQPTFGPLDPSNTTRWKE